MAKSSVAKLAERLAIVAVVVVLVAWAVLTYLGPDEEEAPEAEAPQAEQGQADADAGSEPTADAVEADEPGSGGGQAIEVPEAVPEQPGTSESGQEEAEQQLAPGTDAEPAADAGAEPEAPEAEAPQAEQSQADADAGPAPEADAVESEEPESSDGQPAAESEAVPEQPGTSETDQEETGRLQAPGINEESAADAGTEPEAPEATAPQAEQGQADVDAGPAPEVDAVEAEEPESGDGQPAAESEAVPEQPGTSETDQEETGRLQAPGINEEPAADAAAEPEAPQAEQGQADADAGSAPEAEAVEAKDPDSGDGRPAAESEAVPEQPGTSETDQEETGRLQVPGINEEPAADAAAEPEAPVPDEPEQPAVPKTGAVAPEPETDAGASVGADVAEAAAGPVPGTAQISGQDQTSGDSDELGTGSLDAAATPPAQGQAKPVGGEDAATTASSADDVAVPETAELTTVAETVRADEAPASDGAMVPAELSPDAATASRSQEDQAEQTASGVAASEAAETEELELALLDDGVGQQAADEPAPDAEAAPAAITIPTFDIVRVDAYGTTVIAGRAAPGDKVDAVVNSVVAATETASSRGEFFMLFELDPQSGPLEIALLATGPGGSVRSAETVVVFDPASAADESTSGERAAADPAVLIALEDRVELLQPAIPPAQAESPASELAIESISYGEAGDPTVVAGRGAADGQVRVLVDGRPVMTEQVSESGAWSADLEVPDAATHALRVEELDEAGNIVASVETPFERTFDDGADPERSASQDAAQSGISELDESVSVEIVTVEPGFTLWGISRKYYGKGRLYVRIYHSNLQQIEDPDLIFPGQQFIVPAFETAPRRRPD